MSHIPNAFSRMVDEMGPDYPEALVNLIDALRAYIRVDIETADDLLCEGTITRAEYNKAMIETKQLMMLLRHLEKAQVNPSLFGTIKLTKPE